MDANLTPNKSLGQHWLYDRPTLAAICDAAGVTGGDTVLEIGPGKGTLTHELLARGARVTAVEFDSQLAKNLPHTLLEDGPIDDGFKQDLQHLTMVEADILRFDLTQMPPGYKVVANIPYYLTSNLLRVLCESKNPFSVAALLMQKEVAERACASPGSMSLLSVSTQFYCNASLGVLVPAKLFTPPPKVDSQVLVLRYRNQPLFKNVDTKVFFRIVKAGFSQKRKTLLNSLSGGLAIDKPAAGAMLQAAGIDPNTRAQQLSLNDWHGLYKAYADMV